MKVNIYYGGRGFIEDPTLYVINKFTEVLNELRVEVVRYNLYEEKNAIAMLPKTLKEADGVILATTVEWMGIGGLMQQFLDSCWLYGDKEHLSNLYMFPIVTSTAYGEREAELTLKKAWEILGGIPASGVSAYVEDHVEFETNTSYGQIIEKAAESLYRTINHKLKVMPSSSSILKKNMTNKNAIDLTPQESEQLSIYVSDDAYVKKQKEDIEELTNIFKGMLGNDNNKLDKKNEFIHDLKKNFHPIDGFVASYSIAIEDIQKTLIIDVSNKDLNCYYGEKKDADIFAKVTYEVMNKIICGRMTFQRAFMSGELTAKGNFKTLRSFDELFPFTL